MKNLFLLLLFSLILFSCKKEEKYNPDQHITYTHWYQMDTRSADTLFSIGIPNAFTPNGDGINDYFNIKGNYTLTSFRICNRSNQVLFETTVNSNGWDGRNNNRGEIIQTGTYPYYLKLHDNFGGEYENTGSIMLYK